MKICGFMSKLWQNELYRINNQILIAFIYNLLKFIHLFMFFVNEQARSQLRHAASIRARLFQDGSFLYKNELQIPNGTKLDNAILQIEKVIPILCLNVQILFFHLFFRFFFRLDWRTEISIIKRTLIQENWENM